MTEQHEPYGHASIIEDLRATKSAPTPAAPGRPDGAGAGEAETWSLEDAAQEGYRVGYAAGAGAARGRHAALVEAVRQMRLRYDERGFLLPHYPPDEGAVVRVALFAAYRAELEAGG